VIDVRFEALCGLKSDISRGQSCANRRRPIEPQVGLMETIDKLDEEQTITIREPDAATPSAWKT
jgi:hypothetical protein